MKLRLNAPARLSLAASMLVLASQGAYAASTAAGTEITNQASASYLDSLLRGHTAVSNIVTTVVQQVGSADMGDGSAKNAAASAQVVYSHSITNTGNGADTFTLSATNSGAFSMANVVFYLDANGDGIADNNTPITSTGNLPAGETFRFVAVATLPANAAPGTNNELTVKATSTFNPQVVATSKDTTTVTASAMMDITANGPGNGATGAGAGAETAAVVTNTTTAGATTRFTLYLNNAGGSNETFNLQASASAGFANTDLPAGWTVVFKDGFGNTINNAAVNSGAYRLVYADVTVAAGATPAVTDLYFRALSSGTNVGDIIHTAVSVVNEAVQVTLSKKQALDATCDGTPDTEFSANNITTGAVPGACIRYQITATNTGATDVNTLVIRDTIPAYTTFHSAPGSTTGAVQAPIVNLLGTLSATLGTISPGQSSTMTFGVKISQ